MEKRTKLMIQKCLDNVSPSDAFARTKSPRRSPRKSPWARKLFISPISKQSNSENISALPSSEISNLSTVDFEVLDLTSHSTPRVNHRRTDAGHITSNDTTDCAKPPVEEAGDVLGSSANSRDSLPNLSNSLMPQGNGSDSIIAHSGISSDPSVTHPGTSAVSATSDNTSSSVKSTVVESDHTFKNFANSSSISSLNSRNLLMQGTSSITANFEISTNPSVGLYSNLTNSISNQTTDSASNFGTSEGRKRLKELLIGDEEGECILQFYKYHGKLLPPQQNLLSRLIMKAELHGDLSRIISPERFTHLATEICELFPSEIVGTYFIPYHKDENGRKHLAKGKLYDRYKNRRAAMKRGKVIEGRKKQSINVLNENDNLEPAENEAIDLLKNNDRPWNEVVAKFKETTKQRVSLHRRNVPAYLENYPAFKNKNSLELIEIDFKNLYPEESAFFSSWDKMEKKITALMNDSCHQNANFKILLKSLDIDLSLKEPQAVTANAFFYLPAILPSILIKGKWKPSKLESKDGFILHAKTVEELDQKIANRKRRLAEHQLSLPPFPAIVGPSIIDCDYFVYMNAQPYEVPTLLKAVDSCFKIFTIVEADFPPDCVLLWTFLSEYVYHFKKFYRKQAPYVMTLGHRLASV